MKNYYKIMLGLKSSLAEECLEKEIIGMDFRIRKDLSLLNGEDLAVFNKKFIPLYQTANPDKTKIAAGLAGGTLFTLVHRMKPGDIVLSPNGHRQFMVGEITVDYSYHPKDNLPHQRAVKWLPVLIPRNEVSEEMRQSTVGQLTAINITKHEAEIEHFIHGHVTPLVPNIEEGIENIASFALEKHLEDFLIHNWDHTLFGKDYDIYEEDGEKVGQQYPSDTGPIDILAVSKNKKELLVLELKKGRASDSVVGQIQRYMAYIKEAIAVDGQIVRGAIIAAEDDKKIKRALSMTTNIEFYRFEVSFKLVKSGNAN